VNALAVEPAVTFNDLSSPAAMLSSRRSCSPRNIVDPGPDEGQLRSILSTAIRTPDHGKLAPWRFVIVDPSQRDALADLLKRAYRETKADPGRLELKAIDDFARQAPVLIVALSCPKPDSHIPVWEQELSAGAACMNLLAAAHAQGFVGGWVTGWAAYSKTVRAAFAPDGRIAGFIFLGSARVAVEERLRPDFDEVISHWAAVPPVSDD
jgi:nitroreductase